MPDIFLSYSSQDEPIARDIYSLLVDQKISVFLASISLKPGKKWSQSILDNLRTSTWVFVLASRVACQSANVSQEFGGAWGLGKRIIPIVWDIDPKDLPGWLKEYQAINLHGCTPEQVVSLFKDIGRRIKSENDKAAGLLFFGLVGVLFAIGRSQK